MDTKLTQDQRILAHMVRRRGVQEWFYPMDFMPPRMSLDEPYCVGYEASARLSTMWGQFLWGGKIFDRERDGKYYKYRIRFEDTEGMLADETIRPEIRSYLKGLFSVHGVPIIKVAQASLFPTA